MQTLEIIKLLEKTKKGVFSINDITRIIRKSKEYSWLVLHRLNKKDLITKIEKNKYALKETNDYIIFSNIVYPSYISFLTALSYYNLTTQIPKQIQIVSLKSKKEIRFNGYVLKFIKFKSDKFFGYKREKLSNGFVFIAEPEKAIIDSLCLPKYCSIDEIYNALLSYNGLNIEKLIKYALKMKNIVVLKRLGFLLEKKGIDIHDKIKKKINKKYDSLSGENRKGALNKKWKLIVNESLTEV